MFNAKDYAKKYYKRHKDKWKKYNRTSQKSKRDIVLALKAKPCMDCGGEFPPECMDFDHVRGRKLGAIAELISQGSSLVRVLEEIAKCDLVCANCHRIRTKARSSTS